MFNCFNKAACNVAACGSRASSGARPKATVTQPSEGLFVSVTSSTFEAAQAKRRRCSATEAWQSWFEELKGMKELYLSIVSYI